MADIDTDATLPNISGKSSSAPSTPTETNRAIHGGTFLKSRGKGRRVNFPTDDSIVTGYYEAPDPWCTVPYPTTDNLVEAYRQACEKQAVRPLAKIVKQLQGVTSFGERELDFILKGERLDSRHCETLEEVFKRVQFKHLNLESTFLDDEGAAALFDMIEYYESATHLTISSNKHIDMRGWQACSRMLKKTPCLQHLDAHNTLLNEQTLLILGRALRLGAYLVTLHLENCGIYGRSLVILVAALKLNTKLRDLFLGENKMSPTDGIQIGNLLKANTWLETLDLRGNHLQDTGLSHIAEGLSQQPPGPGDGLKALILCKNQITGSGVKHLTQAMMTAQNLKQLNLGQNNITNEGIHHLKQALICNRSLIYLGLRDAKISCEGAVALAEYLADNRHIRRLDLRENNIQVAGIMALALSMKHNLSVIRLDLDACSKKEVQNNQDDLKDHEKLLNEISEYCDRNKQQMDEKDDENERFLDSPEHSQPSPSHLQFNGIFRARSPVISIHLSSFSLRSTDKVTNSSVILEEQNWQNNNLVNSSHSKAKRSASVDSSGTPPSPEPGLTKNRFRVSRVFLEQENEKTAKDSTTFTSNATASSTSNKVTDETDNKALNPRNGMKVFVNDEGGTDQDKNSSEPNGIFRPDSLREKASSSTDNITNASPGNAAKTSVNNPTHTTRPTVLMRSQSELLPTKSGGKSMGRFSIALVTESEESVAESVRKATRHRITSHKEDEENERQCTSLDSSVTEALTVDVKHSSATKNTVNAKHNNPVSVPDKPTTITSILKSPHSNVQNSSMLNNVGNKQVGTLCHKPGPKDYVSHEESTFSLGGMNLETCSQASTESLPYYALLSSSPLVSRRNDAFMSLDSTGEFEEEMSFDDLYETPVCGSETGKEDKPKKLAFLLPELPESPHRMRKNRRMSTPAMPTSSSIHRPRNLNLKLCRQLESLDLRSSVPLSPTRLMEGWEFPEPMDFRVSSLDKESSPLPSYTDNCTVNSSSEPVTIKSNNL